MTHLYTVQTGQTIWEQQSRLDSLAGVPLSEQGRQSIRRIGKELAPHEPTVIYTSKGEAEQETAALLAGELKLKVKTEKRLVEIDFGLWQGLTMNEIKHRQPRLHKQWLEAPSGVRPPGGETLEEARKRICQAVCAIVKKEKKLSPITVLRPVVLGLLRCRLEDIPLDNIWDQVTPEFCWASYKLDENDISLR